MIIALKRQGLKQGTWLVYPRAVARAPIPPVVPAAVAKDYREASLVLDDSPNASAALSRRCLQHVLRDAGKTKKRDLADLGAAQGAVENLTLLVQALRSQ